MVKNSLEITGYNSGASELRTSDLTDQARLEIWKPIDKNLGMNLSSLFDMYRAVQEEL